MRESEGSRLRPAFMAGDYGLWIVVGVPASVVAWQVWSRRWMSDDGFINVRVMQHILAGHGPVYNLGERVEVATSTLWLALATLGQALAPSVAPGVIMAVLGTALTTASIVLLGLAAARLNILDRSVTLPLGLLIVAALPPVWDFGTAGLETSLSMAWIAACFWGLVVRWRGQREGAGERPAWQPFGVPVMIGLGPLVRPDFALISLVLGLVLLCQSARSWRGWAVAAGLALAIPVSYEVFRAGYYAALVPNTALAKSGGTLGQGLKYVADYVVSYSLWFPAFIVVLFLVRSLRSTRGVRDLGRTSLVIGPVLAAAIHAGFVVSVGGDFMHGRFLIPATFLAVAPVAVVRLGQLKPLWTSLAVVAVGAWAVLASQAAPWGYATDERSFWIDVVGVGAPNQLVAESWRANGDDVSEVERVARKMPDAFVLLYDLDAAEQVSRNDVIPVPQGAGMVVFQDMIGAFGVNVGSEVHIVDGPALSDPIGSRIALPADAGFRVGHAFRPIIWSVARFSDREYEPAKVTLADARTALGCGEIPALLRAVSEPMTLGRFLQNLVLAPRLTVLTIPSAPAQAKAQLCGGG